MSSASTLRLPVSIFYLTHFAFLYRSRTRLLVSGLLTSSVCIQFYFVIPTFKLSEHCFSIRKFIIINNNLLASVSLRCWRVLCLDDTE